MSNYVVLNRNAGAPFCTLEDLRNLPDPGRVTKGVKLEPWPRNVQLHMDPNFPKAIQLPDCAVNLPDAIVVSKRLKEFVEARKPAHMEYLPISIINHKGKVASSEYFILNPFKLQDCIDQAASKIRWNPMDKNEISACTKMVIDEAQVERNAKVFRLEHYPSKVLIERKLAEEAGAAKFTGFDFIEIDEMEY
jgi:hypothetical protein